MDSSQATKTQIRFTSTKECRAHAMKRRRKKKRIKKIEEKQQEASPFQNKQNKKYSETVNEWRVIIAQVNE